MKSNRKIVTRVSTPLLVFLYVLALLLPSHVVNAADQAVTIPKAVVDGMVYGTLWRSAYQDNDAVAALIYDLFVLQAGNGGMSEGDLTAAIGTYMANVEAAQASAPTADHAPSAKETAQSMIEVALTVPALQPYIGAVWNALAGPLGPSGLDQATQIGSTSAFLFEQTVRDLVQTTVPQLVTAAQNNAAVAGSADQVHQSKLGVSIKNFDGRKVAQETPDIAIPPEVIQSIQADGTISISLNEIKDLSVNEFTKLDLSISDMRQTLVAIDAKQPNLVDYIHNQEEQAKQKALAEAKAAEHKRMLEAIESSISIFSTLGGFIDSDFGKQLKTLGESGLKIGKAIDSWLDAVAGKNTLDSIFSASTVVMTGNILGAVMNIVSLFGSSGPTPEQMILEEIGKLRKQVDQLRTEMHARFDRIDQELNIIYTTMQERFDKIDIQLGVINANVLEVQRTLLDLDLKLNRMERNNFELLDAVGRRPLLEAINGGLNYQARTGQAMPFQPDFVNYENLFQTWGTIHAFDALATGPSQRDFSDGALLAELNALPLDANLNYLNSWLQLHGVPALASSRLASPRDWLFASRAYGQLGVEWPQHMAQIDSQRQTALTAVGTDLENAIRNISTIDGPNGPQGNHQLFDTVVGFYNGKVTTLHGKLVDMEAAYIKERFGDTPQVDLFGGVDQVSSYESPQWTTLTCTGSGLATPSGLKEQIPGLSRYHLAEALGLSHLAVCISAELLNPQTSCNPKLGTCFTTGDLQITIETTVDDLPVLRRKKGVGTLTLKDFADPLDHVIDHWLEYKPALESFTSDALTAAERSARSDLLAQITTKIHNTLAEYQHELYGRMLTALVAPGPLHPLAVETTGGQQLLVTLTTLGLAEAVENDEFFHALLYGNQQLVDDNQIVNTLAISKTESITDTTITVNARQLMQDRTTERLDAFTTILNGYLDAIGTAAHLERNATLADARRDLKLAVRIASLPAAPTPTPTATPDPNATPDPTATPVPEGTPIAQGGDNRIYLPVVTR
ncbi:MAG: hypothetical protein R2867_15010 [Caldilineaceae bacterium]